MTDEINLFEKNFPERLFLLVFVSPKKVKTMEMVVGRHWERITLTAKKHSLSNQ